MPFTTLLDRYNTAVEELYSPPSYAAPGDAVEYANIKEQYDATQNWLYDTKKVNFNPGDVDYNWTKLKKGNVGTSTALLKAQGRTLPILAAVEDAKRIAKFQVSGKGLLFLAQQALLQTGNTFATTRIINPLFAVGNTIPFLHLNRSLAPISIPGLRLDASKKLVGKLQEETITNMQSLLKDNIGKLSGNSKNSAQRITTGFFSGGLKAAAKKLASPFKSFKNAVKLAGGGSDNFGLEYFYTSVNFPIGVDDETGKLVGRIEALDGQYLYGLGTPGTGYGKMFYGGITTRIKPLSDDDTGDYSDEQLASGGPQDALNYRGTTDASTPYITRTRLRPTNQRSTVAPNLQLNSVYTALSRNEDADDYIITRIKVGRFNMQFRSFIKDIKENVNSEFTEKNYIGRTERFVSYAGAKRELSFTLQLVAMHQDELLATHTRLNYLIGSLFPVNAIQGLLQPPIVYLTIGDLFSNQPGYFKSLSIDYPYSWDVRESGRNTPGNLQLPMGANINANFTILEKGTVFHQSPFHGVMERL